MKKALTGLLFCLLIAATANAEIKWFKGNTHCHTTNSDGDVSPRQAVRWYHDHGYNFIFITDHNHLTDPLFLDTDEKDDFLLIPGEEISDGFEGKPLHICALNIENYISPQKGASIVDTLQNNLDAVAAEKGLAVLAHPNWIWAFTDREITQLHDAPLVEIYNFSYNCNNFGAGGEPGMEEIWDRVLSTGQPIFGVASDDAHDYIGEFSPKKSNPGTGWIMVKAPALTKQDIVSSLQKGDFYFTNGVLLKDVRISETEYTVEIDADPQTRYTTTFIGKDGRILKEAFGPTAAYSFAGDEMYVRARVFASSGDFACTQPVFMKK
jgi:hypothetical protein